MADSSPTNWNGLAYKVADGVSTKSMIENKNFYHLPTVLTFQIFLDKGIEMHDFVSRVI